MAKQENPGRRLSAVLATTALLAFLTSAQAQTGNEQVLHIGTSGRLAEGTSGGDEKAAMDSLHSLIKSETGFENTIAQQKDWEDLAQQMSKGKIQIGVFQGYEFAWARTKFPRLQALALAVNERPYRWAFVVASKKSKASGFADLKGRKLEVPKPASGYQLLFVNHLSEKAAHQPAKSFFSAIKYADNIEDALDDLVDGVVDAAAVDQVGVESYKRRKPGRFNELKEIARSDSLPPTVIAHFESKLDEKTRTQFKDGLLNANKKERGRTLLTYFHITGFKVPPANFDQVLQQTRKTYPSSEQKQTGETRGSER